jgi:hypothetical protein
MEVFWKLWALGVQDDSTPTQICKGQKSKSYPQSFRLLLLGMFFYLSKEARGKDSCQDQAAFRVLANSLTPDLAYQK